MQMIIEMINAASSQKNPHLEKKTFRINTKQRPREVLVGRSAGRRNLLRHPWGNDPKPAPNRINGTEYSQKRCVV